MHEQRNPPEHAVLMDDLTATSVATAGRAENWPLFGIEATEPRDLDADRAMREARADTIRAVPDVAPALDHAAARDDFATDRSAMQAFEPAWAPEFKSYDRDRVLDDGRDHRTWLIAGALITVFVLGWAGGANSDRFLGISGDTSAGVQKTSAPPRKPGSDDQAVVGKSNRLAVPGPAGAVPEEIKPRKLSAANASAPEQPNKAAAGAVRPAATSADTIASLAQERATPPKPAATQTEAKARQPAAPETRPATIPGWIVRDVHSGTATVEGPGGAWKVAPGDTIPGVGRVHSIVRWGGHWVVATNKGLIATR